MKIRKHDFKWLYAASFPIIILYSLRHVCLGVDLWDGGYQYANFRYSGLEYMDSMWYFATWLANAAGSLLMHLPGGGTMLGMNLYTALITGGIAAFSYDYCVRKLEIPAWAAFCGEIMALSLCWAPSGSLYNYLTYAFLLAGTVFLYQGLTTARPWYLVLAGAALGLNIGVRFSNVAQAGLILAVWYEAFLSGKKLSEAVKETALCMLGYFGAYGVFFLLMCAVYGPGTYGEGIFRLFAMTEHASDYTAFSMLANMGKAYYNATYWLKRYGVAAVCGGIVCAVIPRRYGKLKHAVAAFAGAGLLWWLWKLGYCRRDYRVYDSIYEPCIVILEFAVLLSAVRMADRKEETKKKLLALLLILTVLVTPLGSNNAVYSSINNLFFIMPCFLGMVYDFFRTRRESFLQPFQWGLAVAVLLLGFQTLGFGRYFVYEEATGARDVSTEVTGIPVLEGMYTGADKAEKLETLYDYLQADGLGGRECILYGNIPGIAYYMELAPALNVWSDLRSYGPEIMKADLERVEQELRSGGERPLVILESSLVEYAETGSGKLPFEEVTTEEKLKLLCGFMERNGYRGVFNNGKYAVYE